jgi:hypothetical protein
MVFAVIILAFYIGSNTAGDSRFDEEDIVLLLAVIAFELSFLNDKMRKVIRGES